MMKKFILIIIATVILGITGYFTVIYYATYSEGFRSGELIKISNKGVLFKTWEGELSQGISGAQIFSFSVMDSDDNVIKSNLCRALQNLPLVGRYKIFYKSCRKRKFSF
jgi:hypothetical protein